MNRFIQPFFATIIAIAVLGSGFIASSHSHTHQQPDQVGASAQECACAAHDHDSDSDAPFVPCDDDCQLCKFMNGFGLVSVPSVELDGQNDFQLLSIDQSALVKLAAAAVYLGRAPPTV
jgi:hypothetical protein